MRDLLKTAKKGIVLAAVFTFVFVTFSKKKISLPVEITKYTPHKLDTGVTDSTCEVNPVSSLENSVLNEIQNERKSRIREVCEMCRRNRSSMECNHLTMDEDDNERIMYKNLLVDDKHKVCSSIYLPDLNIPKTHVSDLSGENY